MNDLQKALSLIEAQQKKAGAGTPVWCVGQQLADILNGQPAAAQIVAEDLGTTGMGIADCEKKIAEFASKNRTGNVGFCGPADADRILRNPETGNCHRKNTGGPGGTPPQGNPP